MTAERVQRFSPVEVVFHTIQALLYLILFITGSLLLLQRIFEFQWISPPVLSRIHRPAGIILVVFLVQTTLISIFSVSFRRLWHSLWEVLHWKLTDLVWLIKMPLHVICHKITLPPAGRFNPGQKLHMLTIFLILVGFSASGLWMIIIPGALMPWILHLVCFIPAVLFLAVHIYLSLINPPTRSALTGMITGYVPRSYADTHHSLWLNTNLKSTHTVHVSRWPIVVCTILTGALVMFSVWKYGPHKFKSQIIKVVRHHGQEAILPGALTRSHSEKPEAHSCSSCHQKYSPPCSEKCLVCHDNIKSVMAECLGYHGKLQGECINCHQEHQGIDAEIRPLDAVKFNHDQARFTLRGKHRSLDCAICHRRKNNNQKQNAPLAPGDIQYIGLEFDHCLSCHTDVHKDKRAEKCLQCHTMEGWDRKTLLFAHDRDSSFHLEGKHADTPCEKCHKTESCKDSITMVKLYDVGRLCADCHEDPHNGQFASDCERCHCEQGWKGRWLAESHGPQSIYPLKGKHNKVKCEKCHQPPKENDTLAQARFVNIPHNCQQCHTDPHEGQMSSSCETCHIERGWQGDNVIFDHNKNSNFKLDRLHSKYNCSSCHTGQKVVHYRPLPQTCEKCHEDQFNYMKGIASSITGNPDPHFQRLTCLDCHNVENTTVAPAQYAARCASCHNDHYRDLFYQWSSTLQSQQNLAEAILANTDINDETEYHSIKSAIQETQSIKFHNLELAQSLWTSIEKKHRPQKP